MSSEYRRALDGLARSRGLSAEELAERVHEAEPRHTVRGLLNNPKGGFGKAIDRVIGMDHEEKLRLSNAWAYTFLASKS